MRRLGVLVVEDEQLARERLARLVAEQAEFELVAACGNCAEAMRVMASRPVDIALLDIQMPGISGMEFSEQLRGADGNGPIVVFVTAHKRFAFDAFKVHAADYLLKPFDRARLEEALGIARERSRAREAISLAERIQAVVGEGAEAHLAAGQKASPGRFVVRDNGRFLIVRSEQIDWIEADGRDCVLHCGSTQHVVDGPLAELAERLCTDRFVQVSRSSLVNMDSIAQLQEMFKGDLVAVMKNGQEVPVSRRFRAQVMERLAG
jgi:two-component system LytT family response regulator